MLELKTYTYSGLAEILNCRSKQALERKLDSYNIQYFSEGNRLPNVNYTITKIEDPFRVYSVFYLGFDVHTDFSKLRHFLYHYFCDDYFMSMPDEVKEAWMRKYEKPISRQTITKYEETLEKLGYVHTLLDEFIYYFAYKGEQEFTDRKTYNEAWKHYWEDRKEDKSSGEAIFNMIANYGGYARKQAVQTKNALCADEINYLISLITDNLESDLQK